MAATTAAAEENVLSLLRSLSVYEPGMERDEEMLNFLSHHHQTLLSAAERGKIRKSELRLRLADRFTDVIHVLGIYRAAVQLHDSGSGVVDISRAVGKPSQRVSDWVTGGKRPIPISWRFLKTRKMPPRKPLAREETLDLVEAYARELAETGGISAHGHRITSTLEDMIYLREADFGKPFRGMNLKRELNDAGVHWYDALILKFADAPEKEGEEPLRIGIYGGRKLRKWMFAGNIKGKWDSADDRIDAVRCLAEALLKDGKKPVDIGKADFKGSNILGIDLSGLLERIRGAYSEGSYCTALSEAGIITPDNFSDFRKNPLFRMSHERLYEIRKQAITELLKLGCPAEQIDEIYELTKQVQRLGAGPGAALTEEAKSALRGMPDRFEAILGMRLSGYSLFQTGDVFGLTRERIRQLTDPLYDIHKQMRDSSRMMARYGVTEKEVDGAFPVSGGYDTEEVREFCRRRASGGASVRVYARMIGSYIRHRNELHRYQST